MGQYGLSTTDHGYVAWNGGERRYEYSQPEHHSPALSIYLREEAGIPAGAKLCVYVDDEEKTVTIAEAGYDHDLRDVPPYLLEMLGEAGICLGELEEQLMVGNLIYGERTACNGQEEHGDE